MNAWRDRSRHPANCWLRWRLPAAELAGAVRVSDVRWTDGNRDSENMKARRIVATAAILFLCIHARAIGADADVADAVMRGDIAAVRALVAKGVDVNASQVDGATGLHWAVYNDDLVAAEVLLSAGAKPDVPNRVGMTPLAMAAIYGNVRLVDRLLKAGADAKALGPNGETMVMYAARNGNRDLVRMFVEAGVDVNAREPLRGTTALMWAVVQKNADAVDALLDAGADPSMKSGPAGLPRNYIAPRVNTRAVEEAQRRRERAKAAGRTYEEQLEWEFENNIDLGGPRNAFVPDRSRPAAAAAAPSPEAPAAAGARAATSPEAKA